VRGIDQAPGPTRYLVTEPDRAWAEAWLAAHSISAGERIVAIHPGAGAAVKQWPTANWATVGEALASREVRIVLTGGAAERPLTAALAGAMPSPVVDAAGQTTLAQLAALYRRASLVIGSDSGPLHLAVAVGAPTVHLYGPVPASKFGPWGDTARHIVLATGWPCAPCDKLDWPAEALSRHQCMATITPDAVLQAANSLLASGPALPDGS
jgi:ADP-heptose:LPS heptosyltransferase